MLKKTDYIQNKILAELLESGAQKGDPIPSRHQLCRKYHCSRTTVERAIRINGLWIPDQLTTSCTVRWASKEPDTPLISVSCRFYTEPELAEAIVRE